jgi:hypothetical protein
VSQKAAIEVIAEPMSEVAGLTVRQLEAVRWVMEEKSVAEITQLINLTYQDWGVVSEAEVKKWMELPAVKKLMAELGYGEMPIATYTETRTTYTPKISSAIARDRFLKLLEEGIEINEQCLKMYEETFKRFQEGDKFVKAKAVCWMAQNVRELLKKLVDYTGIFQIEEVTVKQATKKALDAQGCREIMEHLLGVPIAFGDEDEVTTQTITVSSSTSEIVVPAYKQSFDAMLERCLDLADTVQEVLRAIVEGEKTSVYDRIAAGEEAHKWLYLIVQLSGIRSVERVEREMSQGTVEKESLDGKYDRMISEALGVPVARLKRMEMQVEGLEDR